MSHRCLTLAPARRARPCAAQLSGLASAGAGWKSELETFQFTSTSHGRTRDTLPSLIISYDVSPIQAHIHENRKPLTDFVVSLCAIIGGAFSLFGILDGILFTTNREIRKKLQIGKQY